MRTNIEIDDIDHFRSADTPRVALPESLFGRTRIAVGGLVAAEVSQGVRDAKEFKWVRKVFDTFARLDLRGHDLALKASENYRVLRGKGHHHPENHRHADRDAVHRGRPDSVACRSRLCTLRKASRPARGVCASLT